MILRIRQYYVWFPSHIDNAIFRGSHRGDAATTSSVTFNSPSHLCQTLIHGINVFVMPLVIHTIDHSISEMFGLSINKNPNQASLPPQNWTLISETVKKNNVIYRLSGVKNIFLLITTINNAQSTCKLEFLRLCMISTKNKTRIIPSLNTKQHI